MQLFILVAMVALVSPQLFSAHDGPDSLTAPHTFAPDAIPLITCILPKGIKLQLPTDPLFVAQAPRIGSSYCIPNEDGFFFSVGVFERETPQAADSCSEDDDSHCLELSSDEEDTVAPDSRTEIYFLHDREGRLLAIGTRSTNSGTTPQGGLAFEAPSTMRIELARKRALRSPLYEFSECTIAVTLARDARSGIFSLEISE